MQKAKALLQMPGVHGLSKDPKVSRRARCGQSRLAGWPGGGLHRQFSQRVRVAVRAQRNHGAMN